MNRFTEHRLGLPAAIVILAVILYGVGMELGWLPALKG